MYNVTIFSGSQMYIEELESYDMWEKHSDSFRITHRLADGTSIGEQFKSWDVHIIIMDTDTDKPNGFSVLKSAGEEAQNVCVILTGKKSDFKTVKQALVLGAFDYLVKPVDAAELLETLNRAAVKLNRLHQCQLRSETHPLCSDIIECILSGGDDLHHRMDLFLSLCTNDRTQEETSIHTTLRLQSAAVTIYQKICKRLPWITDIVPEPETFVKATDPASICKADELFRRFVNRLSHAVNQYYPTELNGVTKLAVEFILENRFSKLTLADTAEKCFVNKAHLSHVFKQNLGLSFTEYVSGLKMEMLCQMMISSDKQLNEIAEMLGYDDYKYMARIFKSIYGMAPSEYRNDQGLLKNT